MEELYQRYYRAALLYTTSLCGNVSRAEDIVADAFVKAYISLPGNSSSFQYWLFRVCKNLWIDELRKNKRLVSDEMLIHAVNRTTPEALHLSNERYRMLWKAIGTLKPEDRELVTMRYFSELSLREIARMMNKSYPAVRQKLHRLHLNLKQWMEENGYEF